MLEVWPDAWGVARCNDNDQCISLPLALWVVFQDNHSLLSVRPSADCKLSAHHLLTEKSAGLSSVFHLSLLFGVRALVHPHVP